MLPLSTAFSLLLGTGCVTQVASSLAVYELLVRDAWAKIPGGSALHMLPALPSPGSVRSQEQH